MYDKVDCGFVPELCILACVVILVSKSSNYTVTTESLVHERMHRCMESMTYSVKLVIDTKVWFYDKIEEYNETYKEQDYPRAEVYQQYEDACKSEALIQDPIEAMKQSSIKNMNILLEHLEQFSNRCDVKEQIDRSIHNF